MKSTTSYIKENHHTSLLRGPKEIAEIEKAFEKVGSSLETPEFSETTRLSSLSVVVFS